MPTFLDGDVDYFIARAALKHRLPVFYAEAVRMT